VYAMKGNGTYEFWSYQCDSDRWAQKADVPTGSGKPVKGGGAMVYAAMPNALYVFKGNNTLDFFKFGFSAFENRGLSRCGLSSDFRQAMGASQSALRNPQLTISPSIFRNPHSAIRIDYTLPKSGNATLKFYDVTGQLVTALATGHHSAGRYSLLVSHSDLGLSHSPLAHGIYILRLSTETTTLTQKLIIE